MSVPDNSAAPNPNRLQRRLRWLRDLLVPALLALLVWFVLREPLAWWLRGDELYDKEAIKEWVREARVYQTLPELTQKYLAILKEHGEYLARMPLAEANKVARFRVLDEELGFKRDEIREHLAALGVPATKLYPGQLPLFPIIYRLSVNFDPGLNLEPIVWDSQLPRHPGQVQELTGVSLGEGDDLGAAPPPRLLYGEFREREEASAARLSGLGMLTRIRRPRLVFVSPAARQPASSSHVAEQQATSARRCALEAKPGARREGEQLSHEEAERQNLGAKSQIFANIGIMAGNIKNLLVRPNDLLRQPRGARRPRQPVPHARYGGRWAP
ncbi:MAG: hypothetical protein U0793_06260 [Gemmataceae bacterium]